jgi:hypothetical protein
VSFVMHDRPGPLHLLAVMLTNPWPDPCAKVAASPRSHSLIDRSLSTRMFCGCRRGPGQSPRRLLTNPFP